MKLFTKQKETHETKHGCQQERFRERDGQGVWDGHIRTAIFKMDNQQGLTVYHMGLCSRLYGSLDGRGVWGRTDTCACISESLHCSPESITLLISYIPIFKKEIWSQSLEEIERWLYSSTRQGENTAGYRLKSCALILGEFKELMKNLNLKKLSIKKAESRRIDAFEMWYWRRLMRVPWTARRSHQSILKEMNLEYSLEGLMLKLKLQSFGHLTRRTDSFEKTLILGKIEGRRRGRQRMTWLVEWHQRLNGHECE